LPQRDANVGIEPLAAGEFTWQEIHRGFAVAEMPVLADGEEVDRFLLARIDPASHSFQVKTAPNGDKELGDWLNESGEAAIINGSYYSRRGYPDTPIMSGGKLLGPQKYEARHGAFVASPNFVGVRDLAKEPWQTAL
jgi:hypothetical protein